MQERIIFQHGSGVAVLIPCSCGLTVEQIGEKDVPSGIPFWIVDATDIPQDRTFRDAWKLDPNVLGVPNGYGSTN